MRGILEALQVKDRKVFVADSFSGLPKPDGRYKEDEGDIHHEFGELVVDIETVKDNFRKFSLLDENVVFVEAGLKIHYPSYQLPLFHL